MNEASRRLMHGGTDNFDRHFDDAAPLANEVIEQHCVLLARMSLFVALLPWLGRTDTASLWKRAPFENQCRRRQASHLVQSRRKFWKISCNFSDYFHSVGESG
jgi:hypothetical protein